MFVSLAVKVYLWFVELDRRSSKRSAPPPPSSASSNQEQAAEQMPSSSRTSLLRDKSASPSREPEQSKREPHTSPPRISAYSDVSSSIDQDEKTTLIKSSIPAGIGAELLELI